MQLLYWERLLYLKHVHNWACCWLLSLKVTGACPFLRRLLCRSDRECKVCPSLYLGAFAKSSPRGANGFYWNGGVALPLTKVLYFGRHLPDLQLQYSLWGCLRSGGEYRVCPYKLSPLEGTMTLATRSRWTLKPKPFCLFRRVCYKPRTRAGFANLSVNWSQVSPKCKLRFEQNGLSSRWQGGIYDLGWKPSERLTCNQADLGHGYAWRACVYLKQNLRVRFGQ